MKITCFTTDIDGTLKQGGKKTNTVFSIESGHLSVSSPPLDERVRQTLQSLRKHGIITSGCSGWDLLSMQKYLGSLDFYVAENGSIVEVKGTYFDEKEIYGLGLRDYKSILDSLKSAHNSRFPSYLVNPFIAPRKNSYLVIYCEATFYENFEFFREECQEIASKFGMNANAFRKISGNMHLSGVEYLNPLFNKKTGLFFALTDLKLKPEEIAYFGDDLNDLDIFRSNIGLRLAPSNAKSEVLRIADRIVANPPEGIYDVKEILI